MKKFLYSLMVVFVLAAVSYSCADKATKIEKPDRTAVVQTVDQWQSAAIVDLSAIATVAKKGGTYLFDRVQTSTLDAQVILAEDVEDPPGEKPSGGFLSSLGGEVWNVLLMIITSLFGGLYALARKKVKGIGNLFLKAHDYTDDNRLSESERKDLMNDFLVLIGKKKVEQIE